MDSKTDKTVTFSIRTTDINSTITQTFTFEELKIDENMSTQEIKKKVDEIFQVWILDNISFSCIIDGIELDEN
ncbi:MULTISPECIES: hypothetical protein [Bacillaceae]|uniref:hypothetical protein n=1 Tax=Bacillaceae TaxID=186817 RepID=UPI001CB969CC|nr:hypothetical protein [Bacillus sp. HNG]